MENKSLFEIFIFFLHKIQIIMNFDSKILEITISVKIYMLY